MDGVYILFNTNTGEKLNQTDDLATALEWQKKVNADENLALIHADSFDSYDTDDI